MNSGVGNAKKALLALIFCCLIAAVIWFATHQANILRNPESRSVAAQEAVSVDESSQPNGDVAPPARDELQTVDNSGDNPNAKFYLREVAQIESIESMPITKAKVVLRGYGTNAKVFDEESGNTVWAPEDLYVAGMATSPGGTYAVVHFAVTEKHGGNSAVYKLPRFEKVATLPVSFGLKNESGAEWTWISDSKLIGISSIEKSPGELAGMTALDRESEMAIDRKVLRVFDVESGVVGAVDFPNDFPDVFEISEVSPPHYVQLFGVSASGKESRTWFEIDE